MDLLSPTFHFRLSNPGCSPSSSAIPLSSSSSPQRHQPEFLKLRIRHQFLQPLAGNCRGNTRFLTISASAVALDAGKDSLPSEIKVTETKEPRSRVRLSVEVPPNVCQDCYNMVLAELAKQSKVPGFRPGKKVPESILINYVGKQHVKQAAIESVLKRTLPQAMSSVTGRALEDSVRILTKFAEMEESFSTKKFLRYDVVVDVAPDIKWTSESAYNNMKIVVEIDDEIRAEKASELELRRRHKALGSMRIVNDRGLQVGDVVVLDIFARSINQDEFNGESIPSAERKGFHLDTEDGDYLLPGLLDSIIGIQRGEMKTFQLAFPDSWKQESLRGILTQFTVECKELFYRDLPELNDSLADKLISGCSTLSQVRESILQRCKEVEQTAIERATDNAILDKLSEMIEVDIPQSLFEEQGRQLYGAKLLQLQANMKLDEQQLSALSSQKAVNEYLEKERENITNIIKQMLAVGEIFKFENLQYSMDELVNEVENAVAEFKRHNQEYDEKHVRQQVQEILEGAKVLEWLRENADIQYVTR